MKVVNSIKNYFTLRFTLFKAISIYTFQNEIAYVWDSIGNLVSTSLFNIVYLSFINILYANTKLIGGYILPEMQLFYLFAEVGAYLNGTVFNVTEIASIVNRGELDTILIRPLPHLFYMSFRRIKLLSFVRDGLPPLFLIILCIDWKVLNLTIPHLLGGIIIFILGMICYGAFQFIAVLPVFFIGESTDIVGFAGELFFNSGATIPFEGNPKIVRTIFLTIVPSLFFAGLAASVTLGKSEFLPVFAFEFCITIIFTLLKNFLWGISLRNYTSASS